MPMLTLISLLTLLGSLPAHASEGFQWVSYISHFTHAPEHIITFALVAFLIVLAGGVYRYKISKVETIVIPDEGITFRNIVEAYGAFIYDQCKNILGEKYAAQYFSYAATFFIIIVISNLIGLVPGFLPPTEYFSTTFALGVTSFIYFNWQGIKTQGLWKYLKHFAGPFWYLAFLIFPLEILSNFIRAFSLSIRLRGNMLGDHMTLTIFTSLTPFLVPIVFMCLGLLVCVLQAYVFMLLSLVYIALALPHDEHEEGQAEH